MPPNRPIADLLTSVGFTITEVDVFYEKGAPRSSPATPSALQSPRRSASRRSRAVSAHEIQFRPRACLIDDPREGSRSVAVASPPTWRGIVLVVVCHGRGD